MTDIKIDFGCGPNKRQGFLGVDSISFPGVDVVLNVGKDTFPWADGTVSEAHASHFVEHLTAEERMHFVNELYRVMKKGGKCSIITPHWASNRALGDPTHKWPPVAEMWYYYLNKDWRAKNAPHTDGEFLPGGFTCNWSATWGYSLRQDLTVRSTEFQQFAVNNYKEACQDLIATITKE
jgi:SAM-dependent methyltransferase